MKIAILGESPADEAAVELLVGAILGREIVRETIRNYRAPGWTSIPRIVPLVLRTLYFSSDADGLVVVLDSNGTPVHKEIRGNNEGVCDPDCRLCSLRSIARRELAHLTKLPHRKPLRFAVGLAVPAIEAWLLSTREHGINEIAWQMAKSEKPPRMAYTKRTLKVKTYGNDPIPIELETQKMLEHMRDVVSDLNRLATYFPGGFTPLFDEIRSWK